MKHSYRYFKNEDCKFFPCHKADKEEDFNCLFCFCPLYLKKDCGGNFILMQGGLKDCTNCLIPHKNYDYIIKKLKE